MAKEKVEAPLWKLLVSFIYRTDEGMREYQLTAVIKEHKVKNAKLAAFAFLKERSEALKGEVFKGAMPACVKVHEFFPGYFAGGKVTVGRNTMDVYEWKYDTGLPIEQEIERIANG